MENKMVWVEQTPTLEQSEMIDKVIQDLESVGLELIGTRPKDR